MDKLKEIVKQNYNIDCENIVAQQGGWASLAYRVLEKDQSYFLKMYEKSRASTPKLTALIEKYVPILMWAKSNTHLKDNISVPFLTKAGTYKYEDEEGIYMLYDYIEGGAIGERDLNEHQIRQLAAFISELHSYGEEIPVETAAIKEDFAIPFIQQLKYIINHKSTDLPDAVRELMKPHIKQLNDLINTVEGLSVKLKSSDVTMALCHTDLHYWNLMESGQQLTVIDWEGLKLAPVEADLMFLVDKVYFNEFLSIYQKTHRNFAMNSDALQFYLIKRKLEDIWEFLEQLLFDEQSDKENMKTMLYLQEELASISE